MSFNISGNEFLARASAQAIGIVVPHFQRCECSDTWMTSDEYPPTGIYTHYQYPAFPKLESWKETITYVGRYKEIGKSFTSNEESATSVVYCIPSRYPPTYS